MAKRKLLTPARANAKTAKGGEGYEAAILHLAPVKLAGRGSVCPWASEGCAAACLNTSGRGQLRGDLTTARLESHPIHGARIRRTRLFFDDRPTFMLQLNDELTTLARRADRRGKRAVVRLNGTSDLPWEKLRLGDRSLIDRHSNVTFYDYTKSWIRAAASASELWWPRNYHLTYSRSENSGRNGLTLLLDAGVNVAVVFDGALPERYMGRKVIDGLAHDWRFTDPRGVIVGLVAKARAKRDESGFVVDPREGLGR